MDWNKSLTDIFVSADGSDATGDGSQERPFATISAAQRVVRAAIAAGGLKQDVHIYIRGGVYYLEEPVRIGVRDWDEHYQVVYAGYNGEHVRIVGGIPVTGWTDPDGDGIFEADVTMHPAFYALFADGRRLTIAREVNWQDKTVRDPMHLQAVYGSATSWTGEVLRVQQFKDGKMITFCNPAQWSGELQYLQGAREFIDQPGEWALERGKVYYKPEDPDRINESEIIAGLAKNIFRIEGTAEDPVKNIVISGLQLEMNAFGEDLIADCGHGIGNHEYECNLQGIVSLKHTENITVKNCRMLNAGYMGVVLAGHSQRNTVHGNEILHTGFAGIYLIGENPGSLNYINRENTISNNLIRYAGEFVGHGTGMYLINSGDNRIIHNDISYVPRYGISMKGMCHSSFHEACIPEVTFEEHWKYNQTTRNLIAYNRIYNTGIRSGDGGGIEGWGIGRDNVIDHNIIYNAYRGIATTGWRGHSIFLDDAAHHVRVTNNIVYDENAVAVDACIMIKSIDNYVVNNIFDISYAKNGAADICPYGCPAGESTFCRNIIFTNAGGTLNRDGSWTEEGDGDRLMLTIHNRGNTSGTSAFDSMAEMDHNLYFNAVGAVQFSVNEEAVSMEEWKASPANRHGYDAHSICADPLFVDAANRDYRLREGSPAFAMGIESIDASQVGLLPDYPFEH